MRKELSSKSNYYISKERRLELEHYCRQYKEIREKIEYLEAGFESRDGDVGPIGGKLYLRQWSDKVANAAMEITKLKDRLAPITQALESMDSNIVVYILQNVAFGKSYDIMQVESGFTIPIGRHAFYEEVRKFYAILSYLRN